LPFNPVYVIESLITFSFGSAQDPAGYLRQQLYGIEASVKILMRPNDFKFILNFSKTYPRKQSSPFHLWCVHH